MALCVLLLGVIIYYGCLRMERSWPANWLSELN